MPNNPSTVQGQRFFVLFFFCLLGRNTFNDHIFLKKGCLAALIRFHFKLSLPFFPLIGVCIWFAVKLIFFDKLYK